MRENYQNGRAKSSSEAVIPDIFGASDAPASYLSPRDMDEVVAELRLRAPLQMRELARRLIAAAPIDTRDAASGLRFFDTDELQTMPEPEVKELAEGLVPVGGNLLIAGAGKSHKTHFLMDLAVSLASATPFLGHFRVPERRRVGLVLMEGARHQLKRRLFRICRAHGVEPGELRGWLFVAFRPPLKFADSRAMAELGAFVAERDIDFLGVDHWTEVGVGDSNRADDVAPQLSAFADLRRYRDGLTVALNTHARKEQTGGGARDGDDGRLTDIIRGSSAFGAWYDAGLVLSRADERAPVRVRAELRDLPSPEPFAFVVEDEFPAGPDVGPHPEGYLRLRTLDEHPAVVEINLRAARLVPAVEAYLREHPGCPKRRLREDVGGKEQDVLAAFDQLCAAGRARYEEPERRGQSGRCWLIEADRCRVVPGGAQVVPGTAFRSGAPAPHTPPLGGVGTGHHPVSPAPEAPGVVGTTPEPEPALSRTLHNDGSEVARGAAVAADPEPPVEGDEPWPTEPALEDVGFLCTACGRVLAPDEDAGGAVCFDCAEREAIQHEGEEVAP